MRVVGLITGTLLVAFAFLAYALPGVDRYQPGVDDGPPQQFTTIADAEKAAGFDFPDAGLPQGWKIQTVVVVPVYYGQRLLNERPELTERRMSIRDAVTSGRVIPGVLRFWLTDGLPDPPPGVHNYVSILYVSDNGVVVSLEPYQPGITQEPSPPMSDVTDKSTRDVRIGVEPARLITYTSQSSTSMVADWRVGRVPVRATAFSFSRNERYALTRDQFIAFLANVR